MCFRIDVCLHAIQDPSHVNNPQKLLTLRMRFFYFAANYKVCLLQRRS